MPHKYTALAMQCLMGYKFKSPAPVFQYRYYVLGQIFRYTDYYKPKQVCIKCIVNRHITIQIRFQILVCLLENAAHWPWEALLPTKAWEPLL